jgi:hypothetical protein
MHEKVAGRGQAEVRRHSRWRRGLTADKTKECIWVRL